MVKVLYFYLHLPFYPQFIFIVFTILGSGNGRNNENQGKSVRPSSSMSTLPEEEDLCSHCGSSSGKQKSRKWSCYSIIFLLAVDAFTIGLVLVLFSHHNYHTGKYWRGALLVYDYFSKKTFRRWFCVLTRKIARICARTGSRFLQDRKLVLRAWFFSSN
jgi:molybdopterin/thiamine biosynthesis adenylyltransferase